MYCSKCGKQIEDGAMFCPGCGAALQNNQNISVSNQNTKNGAGMAIASLVLGIIGIIAWIIPIIGLPIGIVALILGVLGIKRSSKGMSIAGIVLAVICLVLTIINSAIGAYQGYHKEAWFQKGGTAEVEEEKESDTGKNVFTLRDSDGNILMTGGIQSAQAEINEDSNGGLSYVVSIEFTDSAAETFYQITEEHIGESIGIYLNDEMISNPVVTTAISGGTCQISGNGLDNYKDAEELASLLLSTK
jgi:hypothetical protein